MTKHTHTQAAQLLEVLAKARGRRRGVDAADAEER
jgi:hypothetical protein